MRKLRHLMLENGALLVFVSALGCTSGFRQVTPVDQPASRAIQVNGLELDSLFYRGAQVDIVGRRIGSVYGGDYDSYRGAFVASVNDERQLSWNILNIGRTLLTAAGYATRSQSTVSQRPTSLGGTRFVLSGQVTKLTLDRHEQPGRTSTDLALEIRWQVYDRYKDDLVYSRSMSAEGESGPAVVEEIVMALVSDPRFAGNLADRTQREPIPGGVRTGWLALVDSTQATGAPQTIIISRADLNPSRAGSVFESFAGSVISITTPTGSGSGFIISRDGLALTNHHVVEEEEGLVAHLWNGQKAAVTVLRRDPALDAALIQFECKPSCITAPLGSSTEVYVGDDVYTIGSPRSLRHTLTKGVVSGFREGVGGMTYIQTDAAVSHGNSGGPLIDARGHRVIGIVSWKLLGPGDEGLGFAVAIEDALRVLGIEYFGGSEAGT